MATGSEGEPRRRLRARRMGVETRIEHANLARLPESAAGRNITTVVIFIDAGSRVATLPESYADRLTEIFPGPFVNMQLLVLDRYDLALSKLERNIDRDLEDVQLLSRTEGFDVGVLRERYLNEVRPFVTGPVSRHDLTLDLWVEMIEELRGKDDG